ncbi:hypothetical protein [Methylomonas methanica]|uniref:Secreted protein with PEP-CTERM sorting signal n=1 Tax=Methylomonas methanica (strain DSM 25384 / MC09) TaxID=857087 RepID=G0A5T3_METMM|nr:hypothetical protein [Methylomonas methanica]AEF99210.1 hypothetical protein Metme_0770 [Methylomonas methanica MC09]
MHFNLHFRQQFSRPLLKPFALCSFAALSMLAAAPAHAFFHASCNSYAGVLNSPACSDYQTGADPLEYASARSDAFMGRLRAEALVSLVGHPLYDTVTADAHAVWTEQGIVINAPDPVLQGQRGDFYFNYSFHGSLSADGAGQARVGFIVGGGAPQPFGNTRTLFEWYDNPSDLASWGDKAVNILNGEAHLPIIFGEPFDITFRLDSLAMRANRPAYPTGAGSASSSFFNTAYWGGISKITGPDGNVVTGYGLVVPSGFDLASAVAPVPLPPAVWLFATGLFAVLGRRTHG